jgi:hypothetical protein
MDCFASLAMTVEYGVNCVGWAKERSDVPTVLAAREVVGTLRFAHPTGLCSPY